MMKMVMTEMSAGGSVFSYYEQPQMQVEVILASRAKETKIPIFTVRLRYPRIIHPEMMTHRDFSRNARSSRAVPVKTMLDEIRNIPFVPWHWGKNQKGMQASEECNELLEWAGASMMLLDGTILVDKVTREEGWLKARDFAVKTAEIFSNAGYHKQVVNRLIESFSWIDTLITSTQWENFFHLRNHGDAEPHLQDLARLVLAAISRAELQDIPYGSWHLPYITDEDWMNVAAMLDPNCVMDLSGEDIVPYLRKISAARCARISYKPFDGRANIEAELERYDTLVSTAKPDARVHASPVEHQATPDRFDRSRGVWSNARIQGNFFGWKQFRKMIPGEAMRENFMKVFA